MVAPLRSSAAGKNLGLRMDSSESQSARMRSNPAAQRSGRSAPGTWLTPTAVQKACCGELLVRGRSATGVTTDSRQGCEGKLFVALRGDNHDGHDHVAAAIQNGARGVVIARDPADVPGLDGAKGAFVVRVADARRALLDLAKEHRRRNRAKVIGITGSCGKTTTKEWLGAVLSAAMPTVRSPGSYNNDVGVPLTLFSIQPETRAAVVEIGTNAPGEIGCLTAVARPDVAIVTCVAPAHLQGLGSIEGVAREKGDLPRGVHEDGLCILNGDDANVRAMADSLSCRVEFVSTRGDADWFATDIQTVGEGTTFRLKGGRVVELPRAGMHNVYNALFVLAAAAELGVPEDDAITALCAAKPASRRFEPKRAGGVDILDDSYNMNPESARAGLQALAGMPTKGRRIIAFGEMLKLGDHSYELHQQLGTAVWRAGIDVLVAVGAGSKPIADGAIAAGMPRACVHFVDSVESAQALLMPMLRDGDRLLCKASRRVGLDRLVDALMASLSAADGGASPGQQTAD